MNRFESKEDYLERILVLSEKNEKLRAIDIANYMNYSKPSVSIALKKLKTDELINVDKNGIINLTNKGKEIAIEIYERHKIISSALIMIGVDLGGRRINKKKIEHDISHETFIKLKEFIERGK